MWWQFLLWAMSCESPWQTVAEFLNHLPEFTLLKYFIYFRPYERTVRDVQVAKCRMFISLSQGPPKLTVRLSTHWCFGGFVALVDSKVDLIPRQWPSVWVPLFVEDSCISAAGSQMVLEKGLNASLMFLFTVSTPGATTSIAQIS
jgi:hypothetical protein